MNENHHHFSMYLTPRTRAFSTRQTPHLPATLPVTPRRGSRGRGSHSPRGAVNKRPGCPVCADKRAGLLAGRILVPGEVDMDSSGTAGFTLVELVVAMTVIAVLAVMLVVTS